MKGTDTIEKYWLFNQRNSSHPRNIPIPPFFQCFVLPCSAWPDIDGSLSCLGARFAWCLCFLGFAIFDVRSPNFDSRRRTPNFQVWMSSSHNAYFYFVNEGLKLPPCPSSDVLCPISRRPLCNVQFTIVRFVRQGSIRGIFGHWKVLFVTAIKLVGPNAFAEVALLACSGSRLNA